MEKLLSALIITLFLSNVFSQKGSVINNEVTHFQLLHKKDTIDFILVDTACRVRKPIMLFCQGSLPIPLIIEYPDNKRWVYGGGTSNFDCEEIKKKYHIIVISMPHTPLISKVEHLNSSYAYISDAGYEHSYLKSFQLDDRIENYVKRANAVLDFVQSQKWAKKDSLCIWGHSQGAKIALKVTNSRNDVYKLGLLSFNPLGRVDQKIRQLRIDVDAGRIDWDYAQKKTQSYYQFIDDFNNADSINVYPEYISWKSFSKPLINDVTSVKCPVYIAYGSSDISAQACDLLPIYFLDKGKKDFVIKRYVNLDHNFFPVKNPELNNNWPLVASEFYKWILGD